MDSTSSVSARQEEGRLYSAMAFVVAPSSLLPEGQLFGPKVSQALGSGLRVNQMEGAGGLESKISASNTVTRAGQ